MCAHDMGTYKSVLRTFGVSLLFAAMLLFYLGASCHYDRRLEEMTPGPRVISSSSDRSLLPRLDEFYESQERSVSHVFGKGSSGTHPTVEEPFVGRAHYAAHRT